MTGNAVLLAEVRRLLRATFITRTVGCECWTKVGSVNDLPDRWRRHEFLSSRIAFLFI